MEQISRVVASRQQGTDESVSRTDLYNLVLLHRVGFHPFTRVSGGLVHGRQARSLLRCIFQGGAQRLDLQLGFIQLACAHPSSQTSSCCHVPGPQTRAELPATPAALAPSSLLGRTSFCTTQLSTCSTLLRSIFHILELCLTLWEATGPTLTLDLLHVLLLLLRTDVCSRELGGQLRDDFLCSLASSLCVGKRCLRSGTSR